MIFKFTSFLIGIIWSYSLIKTQSIFSKKAGLLFKIFISKVSWFTFLAAIYFGYKNFQIKFVLIGLIVGLLIVNLGFYFLKKIINQKFSEKQILNFKRFFEYTLIFLIFYFVLF